MAKGKSGSAISALVKRRSWIQAATAAVWLFPFVHLSRVCGPVFHCHACPLALFACPIGVLASFSALHTISFAALGGLLVYGAVFGSFICGWVCPFGFLQDLLAKVPVRKFELSSRLGYGRYVVLGALVLAVPFWYGERHPLFVCRVCPAGALEAAVPKTVQSILESSPAESVVLLPAADAASRASPPAATDESSSPPQPAAPAPQLPGIRWPSPTKTAILCAFLGLAVFVRRPWCTVFCPLGAIYGLFNRVSIFFLRFEPSQCNHCERCRDFCHYGGLAGQRAGDEHCIRCLDCARCNAIQVGCVLSPEKAAAEDD